MTIYPGDPRERFRTRRRLLSALGGLLFLPAQGVFLVTALRSQTPLAWISWGVILTALVVAAVVWVRDPRTKNLELAPWTPGPLLITEVAALIIGLIVRSAL